MCKLFFFYRALSSVTFITGRMSRSSIRPVLNLLLCQKSALLHRMGDSLYGFTWNLAQLSDTWIRLVTRNFTPIGSREWERGSQNIKNHFLVNSRLARAKPLTDFYNYFFYRTEIIFFYRIYAPNYPALNLHIWHDSLRWLRSYCLGTARRSIRPIFPCTQ